MWMPLAKTSLGKWSLKCYITLNRIVSEGCVHFPDKKCYEGVRFNIITVTRGWVGFNYQDKKSYKVVLFNVISITRGWVDVKFLEKEHYVTLEWHQK